MKKLFKFLKPYGATIAAIIAVLFVQAMCDLSLPTYTSDIVNVGIQQGGIDRKVPDKIAVEDMEKLLLFVPQDKQETVRDAYRKEADTYEKEAYILEDVSDKKEEELFDILGKPMLFVMGSESKGAEMEQMKQMMAKMPKEKLPEMLKMMDEKLADMPETMLDQTATMYVKSAYKNLGVDTDKVQNRYIIKTGIKMLGLAMLAMIASIMVGFLASRVAASTGRDLRGRVFKKVVGFSNGEFDKFSTASLITRSTNDVQQIQMLTVMLLRMVLYAPIVGIGGVIKVVNTNVSMGWIIALAVLLILGVVMVLFTVAMPKFKILQNLVDKLNLVTREILTGLPVIRAFSTEKHEEVRFDQANKALTRTNLFVNRAMTL